MQPTVAGSAADGAPPIGLIRNARLVCGPGPEPQDLLIVHGRIVAIAPAIAWPDSAPPAAQLDAAGRRVLPGLVDLHVHITGGGGEGGFVNRTPPVSVEALAEAGITTAVGLLGTDGVSRSVADLIARARSLRALGVSVYAFTGAYAVPTPTLTGSVRGDLMWLPEVRGTGEIAISDHRGSQPEPAELARLAADTRVGALLAGKPGLVHLHVGGGRAGLEIVRRVLAETELPAGLFMATHLNRTESLLAEGADLVDAGGRADVTAGTDDGGGTGLLAYRALADLLSRAKGHPERVTMSSDAGGSAPVFDTSGALVRIEVARPDRLWQAVRRAVLEAGVPLALAAATVTAHAADALGLARKGRLAPGADADLIVLGDDLALHTVMARGRVIASDGRARVRGPFDATRFGPPR